ncbi:hypothetical protein Bbelb_400650 [Branchiostoma belcheri]|nr:hypothetical protein Bbelb_400650 [Branchiostoma belcheri]
MFGLVFTAGRSRLARRHHRIESARPIDPWRATIIQAENWAEYLGVEVYFACRRAKHPTHRPGERSSPFGAVVAISERPNFSSEYPRHVRDFPEFFECVKSHFLKITSRLKTGQNLARWIEVAWNSGKSRTCRGYSELKFGRSEMATTAPKGDDRSEKRRRPFGKATTVYETEICIGAG